MDLDIITNFWFFLIRVLTYISFFYFILKLLLYPSDLKICVLKSDGYIGMMR